MIKKSKLKNYVYKKRKIQDIWLLSYVDMMTLLSILFILFFSLAYFSEENGRNKTIKALRKGLKGDERVLTKEEQEQALLINKITQIVGPQTLINNNIIITTTKNIFASTTGNLIVTGTHNILLESGTQNVITRKDNSSQGIYYKLSNLFSGKGQTRANEVTTVNDAEEAGQGTPDISGNREARASEDTNASFSGKVAGGSGGSANKHGSSTLKSLTVDTSVKDIVVSVTQNVISIRFSQPVLFDSGQAKLKQRGLLSLNKLGDLFAKIKSPIIVEGHTDNVPIKNSNFSSNWQLSFERSYTIISYLIDAKHISPKRLTGIGYADTRPISANITESGRSQNRRIEIKIIMPNSRKFASDESIFNL